MNCWLSNRISNKIADIYDDDQSEFFYLVFVCSKQRWWWWEKEKGANWLPNWFDWFNLKICFFYQRKIICIRCGHGYDKKRTMMMMT